MLSVFGIVMVLLFGWKLYRSYRFEQLRRSEFMEDLFAPALSVIRQTKMEQQGPHELPRLVGNYRGFPVQVKPVIDTLPTRRLPALWMLVTVQCSLPLAAKFDMMMRPAGPTTFSNFDLLPHTLEHPTGFPEHAVIRTDDADNVIPAEIIRPYIGDFFDTRAKELLITENGVRLVWLLAEADRARYGIFRQAEFGDVVIDEVALQGTLETLLDIREAVLEWSDKKR